jgi:hypothetical protein
MSSEWYYESMGLIIGPLTSTELLRKVRGGEIREGTRVRKGDSQWVNAIEVNGLFDAAMRAAFQYNCPYCGGEIDRPPTLCLQCDREIAAAYIKRDKTATPSPVPPASSSSSARPSAPSAAHHQGNGATASTTRPPSMLTWLKSLVKNE